MNFIDVVEDFRRSESGTDSFKILYRDLLKLMQIDPTNAAAYYILSTAAHNYVLYYEDQAVEPETADAAKISLLDFCDRFAEACKGSAEEKFSEISLISNEYEWKITSF